METILFVLLIGVCVAVLLWSMNRSRTRADLARRRKKPKQNLLVTPADTVMAHKDQLWETRRKRALRATGSRAPNAARSEPPSETGYDGYSRRHRHHLTPTGRVSREHPDAAGGDFEMTSIRSGSGARGPATGEKH